MEGAVERVRPKMMTVTAIMAGLLPILWGDGAGASVMKRIAAPMVGGMVSSTVLTLVVIPAVYALWRGRSGSPRRRQCRMDGEGSARREAEGHAVERLAAFHPAPIPLIGVPPCIPPIIPGISHRPPVCD